MRGYTRGEKNRSYGPVEWIRKNVEFRESSLLEFLSGAGSRSDKLRAVVRRHAHHTNYDQPFNRAHVFGFNAIIGSGYATDLSPPGGGGLWSLAGMGGHAPGFSNHLSTDGTADAVTARDERAETISMFIHPGLPLPFGENRFNSVTVGSSVRHVPDFTQTLREIHRVLKPGGALRLDYETVEDCSHETGRQIWLSGTGDAQGPVRLMLCEVSDGGKSVRHYGLLLGLSGAELTDTLGESTTGPFRAALAPDALRRLCEGARDAVTWVTEYPCCRILLRLLSSIGFESVRPGSLAEDVLERIGRRQTSRQKTRTTETEEGSAAEVEDLVLNMNIPADFPRGECGRLIKGVK